MTSITHREWRIIEFSIVIIIAVVAWGEIRRSHDLITAAVAKAEVYESTVKQLEAERAKLASDNTQQISQLRAELEKIKTPAQAAASVPTYFPDVKIVPMQVPSTPTASNPNPTPQMVYTMTPEVMMSLAKSAESCQECQVNLTTAKASITNLQNELTACNNEVQTWKKAAKGGSFFDRLKHDAKVVGLSVITGVILGRGLK
jgi:hypothetical protein